MSDTLITLAQLRRQDGTRGTRKWIAHNGTAYDVTDCPRWKKDLHENLHFAGQDLSSEIDEAPHNAEVFGHPCLKIVGKLQLKQP